MGRREYDPLLSSGRLQGQGGGVGGETDTCSWFWRPGRVVKLLAPAMAVDKKEKGNEGLPQPVNYPLAKKTF